MQGPLSGLGQVRAIGVLNGGGAPLKLRTTGGKIRLQFMDSQLALRDSLMREQEDRLNKRFVEVGFPPVSFPRPSGGSVSPQPDPKPAVQPGPPRNLGDLLEDWINGFERRLTGNINEDPDEFLKRLTYRPNPSYPTLAQRAGVHGVVLVQVKVTK